MGTDRQSNSAWADRVLPTIARVMLERTGIEVDASKADLIVARFSRAARRVGAPSAEAFAERLLERIDDDDTAATLMEELTTHYTYFHREAEQWRFFAEKILPEAIAMGTKRRDLRIWCAAASTGEEPYEIAMMVLDALAREHASWLAGVLATDVSARALEAARKNRYLEDQVARLPPELRARHLVRNHDGTSSVSAPVASEVLFRELNLTHAFPFSGRFHVVFCRNVLMYFANHVREDVELRLAAAVEPGGYLLLGAGEGLRQHAGWRPAGASIYRRL